MASRRWLLIVLGVVLVLFLGMAALAGSCAYLVRQQVQVKEQSSAAEYEREAAAVLARFEGVPTLVEDGASGPRLSKPALAARQQRTPVVPVKNLNVLVYSVDESKLVRLSIPFWLLRLAPNGQTGIDVNDVDFDKMRVSVDEMESAGPGPIFIRKRKDARVLVWAE